MASSIRSNRRLFVLINAYIFRMKPDLFAQAHTRTHTSTHAHTHTHTCVCVYVCVYVNLSNVTYMYIYLCNVSCLVLSYMQKYFGAKVKGRLHIFDENGLNNNHLNERNMTINIERKYSICYHRLFLISWDKLIRSCTPGTLPACTEPLNKRLSSASVQGCINVF